MSGLVWMFSTSNILYIGCEINAHHVPDVKKMALASKRNCNIIHGLTGRVTLADVRDLSDLKQRHPSHRIKKQQFY